MRKVPVVQFKAKCLAYLARLQKTGGQLIVTKRGKPLATISPLHDMDATWLAGSIEHQDDLIRPVDRPWDADER